MAAGQVRLGQLLQSRSTPVVVKVGDRYGRILVTLKWLCPIS